MAPRWLVNVLSCSRWAEPIISTLAAEKECISVSRRQNRKQLGGGRRRAKDSLHIVRLLRRIRDHIYVISPTSAEKRFESRNKSQSNYDLCHRWMVHLSLCAVENIGGAETNVMNPNVDLYTLDCPTCVQTVFTKLPATRKVFKSSLAIIVRKYMCGPIKHSILGGNSLVVAFTSTPYCISEADQQWR